MATQSEQNLIRRAGNTLNQEWVKNLALGSVLPLGLGIKLAHEDDGFFGAFNTTFAGLCLVVALNLGYTQIAKKNYLANEGGYEVKIIPHRSISRGGAVLDIVSYLSPLGKVVQRACSDDVTILKSKGLKYKVGTGKLIGFDKEKGYFLDTLELNNAGIKKIIIKETETNIREYASRERSKKAYDKYNRIAEKTYYNEVMLNKGNIEKIVNCQTQLNNLQSEATANDSKLKTFQREINDIMNPIIQKYNAEYNKLKVRLEEQREQLKASAEYDKLKNQVSK